MTVTGPRGDGPRLDQKDAAAVNPCAALAGALEALRASRRVDGPDHELAGALLAHRGEVLDLFKDCVDRGGGTGTLRRLVFQEIDSPEVRAKVLAHLAAHAGEPGSGALKVLSDFDDTFAATTNDVRYPPGTLYPGARTFLRVLAEHDGHVGILTARGELLADEIRAVLAEAGLADAFILPGSFRYGGSSVTRLFTDVVESLGLGGWLYERMAAGKVNRFNEYAQLFSEDRRLSIGDNGQGDVYAAIEILLSAKAKGAAALVLALIHEVVESSPALKARAEAAGVKYFKTYVGAARHALEAGLITRDEAARVLADARRELALVAFPDGDPRRAERQTELEADARALGLS